MSVLSLISHLQAESHHLSILMPFAASILAATTTSLLRSLNQLIRTRSCIPLLHLVYLKRGRNRAGLNTHSNGAESVRGSKLHQEPLKMQEGGEEWRHRPVAAYQGKTMRVDRELLRDVRTGLEAALRQSDRVSCCGEESGKSVSLPKEGTDDDDSAKVVRFLDGCRVESPLPSSALLSTPITESFDGTDYVQDGEAESQSGWIDYDVQQDEYRRKDSAFDVSAQPNPTKDDASTAARVKEAVEQQEPNGDDYSEAPRTPMVVTLGPKKDLDWLRFSYLVRNDKLSFNDIAELVTRSSPNDNASQLEHDAWRKPSAAETPCLGDIALSVSVREPGNQLATCDVSPLEELAPVCTFGHVSGARIRRVTGLETGRDDGTLHYGEPAPLRAERNGNQTRNWEALYQPPRDTYGNTRDTVYSCFSSDLSVLSIDYTSKLSSPANKAISSTASWWKPKREKEGTSQHSLTLTNLPLVPPKVRASHLWQRMSKSTFELHSSTSKLERKSRRSTLSCSTEERSPRVFRASSHIFAHRSSDCHPAPRPFVFSSLSTATSMRGSTLTSATKSSSRSHRVSSIMRVTT